VITVEPHLVRYLAAVQDGERREAINIALALLQQGVSAERVITDLLARAQTRIGLGWQEGHWSVAREHRASAITESALQAVVQQAMGAPGAVREGSLGPVVIVCSESEWHVLPGRMAAEVLRLRGADVSFVEPSVPADELPGLLGDDPPAAVAVTCSMPMSLVGAWRSISALRACGMTIVCAGRGFGPDGRWGLALGADHWAPDFTAGADLLLSVVNKPAPAPREPAGAPRRIDEVRLLGREHRALVEEATQTAFTSWPAIRESEAAMRATREGLAATLRVIGSATLVNDLALATDYVSWFQAVLVGHGQPAAVVPSAFDILLQVLPEELACARATARSGRDACSGPGLGLDYSL
jgi:methanogenic corrinoid protein MtbC1